MITSDIHAKTDALPDKSWQGFTNFNSMLPIVVLDVFWAAVYRPVSSALCEENILLFVFDKLYESTCLLVHVVLMLVGWRGDGISSYFRC